MFHGLKCLFIPRAYFSFNNLVQLISKNYMLIYNLLYPRRNQAFNGSLDVFFDILIFSAQSFMGMSNFMFPPHPPQPPIPPQSPQNTQSSTTATSSTTTTSSGPQMFSPPPQVLIYLIFSCFYSKLLSYLQQNQEKIIWLVFYEGFCAFCEITKIEGGMYDCKLQW